MSDGGAPPRPDVTSTLGRFALGAVGLIVGAALLFGIVGALNGDGGEAADGAQGGATSAPSTPADTGSPAPAATGEVPSSPAPADTGSPASPASPAPTDTGSPEPPSGIDPADVSVQVLDAVGDGGAAAGSVADRIEAAGYDLIAENRAARNYDVTTVFYTEGNEDAARQIAADFGFSEVAPQPGNLSSAVAVHVVVGQDAA